MLAGLGVLVVTLAAAFAAGSLIPLPRMPLPLRLAGGLAILAQSFLLLGACGLLRRNTFLSVALVLAVTGLLRRRSLALPARRQWAMAALLVVLVAPMFVLTLYPPFAFDEIAYHLPSVRAFAQSGRLPFLPSLLYPAFPQLHEILSVPAFLFAGDTATHAVTFVESLLLAALLVIWGNEKARPAGWLAAALWLGHPIVVWLGATAYVDIAFALFVACGFHCAEKAHDGSSPFPWLTLGGFFLGTACGVKYLGWFFLAAAIAFVLTSAQRRLGGAALLTASALVAAAPSYVRLVVLTGNPLFPFLPEIFGPSRWTLPIASHQTFTDRAGAVIRLAWDVTFARTRTGLQPPLSVTFLLTLLVVLAAAPKTRKARFLALISLLYFAFFTWLPADSRYLLPLVPLLAVTAAATVAPMLAARPRSFFAALTLACILPGTLYAGWRIARQGVVPSTPAQRDSYLVRNLPGYAALRAVGRRAVYACGCTELTYYAGGPFVGNFNGPWSFAAVLERARTPAALRERLLQDRIELLLSAKGRCPASLQPWRGSGDFELAYEDSAAEIWRVRR